jgi:isoleucyl-tRNA synthetase
MLPCTATAMQGKIKKNRQRPTRYDKETLMTKTDYKVNLPQTSFPMKANLAEREPKIIEFWEKIGLRQKMAQTSPSHSKKFILHDGPPYANGEIHLGHVLDKVFKDIINKINFMAGYAVPYVPGWDCHGLPIELNVEKKLGKAGHKVSITEFMKACRTYAASQVAGQMEGFKRLGILGNWEHPYLTMDYAYEANIIRALAKIIAHGYLARGYKPVHWCTACGSALAEAEVEYKDKTSPAIDVRFRFVDAQKLGANENVKTASIAVWTTTPWTLPANEAVALHPEYEYVLISHKPASAAAHETNQNEYLLLLKELAAPTLQRYGTNEYSIIKSYTGKELAGLKLHHPFLDKEVPIILGEHVTTDTGTGAVHTAPAHGLEDYVVAQQYKLPTNNPVGSDGKFFADTPYFGGKDVFAANDEVIALLKERGNLLHHTTIQHSYPHCWRHKTPLIFRATQQWFVSMDQTGKYGTLRTQAMQTIEQINWLHPHGKERITKMVSQRPDWCISRQRFWGTPMAMFVHKQSGELHPEISKLMEAAACAIAKEGIIFWQQLDEAAAQQFLMQYSDTQKYPAHEYTKVTDTLDVWFDSGVSHFCVMQQRLDELQFPANLYCEGSDQYRGWFQSSLLTALAIYGTPPYRNVISHGFTVDGAGHKMSKSLGNVINPAKIIKSNGADILRLWLATSFPYDDISVSEEIIKGNIDTYRKLRNTARYLLSNLYDFNPHQNLVAIEKLLPLDRWALNEVIKLQEEVAHNNNQKICLMQMQEQAPHHHAQTGTTRNQQELLFKFYTSCARIQYVASVTLSSFYFSIIKDRLYTMKADSVERRSAQTALYHMLEIYVRLLAPFISFTAEEIWQCMREMFTFKGEKPEAGATERAESVFLATPYTVVTPTLAPFSNDDWQNIQLYYTAITKEIEKLRAAGTVGSSLECEVALYCDEKVYGLLQKFASTKATAVAAATATAATSPTAKEYAKEHAGDNDFRFILITSNVAVIREQERPQTAVAAEGIGEENKMWIVVTPTTNPKCARCWHHRADVGANPAHPELCERCSNNFHLDA